MVQPNREFVKNIGTYSPFVAKTIVVDNSADDNSHILTEVAGVEYIPLMANLGIATALNIGYKRAADLGAAWVLTMDQDSWFDGNAAISYRTLLQGWHGCRRQFTAL